MLKHCLTTASPPDRVSAATPGEVAPAACEVREWRELEVTRRPGVGAGCGTGPECVVRDVCCAREEDLFELVGENKGRAEVW